MREFYGSISFVFSDSSTGTHSDDCESYRTVPNMTTGSEGEDQEKPRQYYPFELIPGFFQVSLSAMNVYVNKGGG